MKKSGSENELRKMMKRISLESPDPDFSSRVMQAVLNDEKIKPVFMPEPLLGKSFWILVTIFIALAVILVLFPGSDKVSQTGAIQNFFNNLPRPDWNYLTTPFSSLTGKAGSLPGILSVVMTGATVLILVDKFLTEKIKISAS